jgi:hypothetical protein
MEAEMEDDERTTRPATIGEIRQRLRSMGGPWTVPARFSDDDPLPDLPPQPADVGRAGALRPVNTREEFEDILRDAPPVNPFLAARWRELGLAVPGPAEGTSASGQDMPEWGVG